MTTNKGHMNKYKKYWELFTTPTAAASCSEARNAILRAETTDNLEVKKKFLLYSIKRLDVTMERLKETLRSLG